MDGERVRCGGDERGGRRRYDPLAEDRSHAGQPTFEVVILEMLATSQQSGSSANGARLGRRCTSRSSPVSAFGQRGDDGVVDRSVVADEPGIGAAELDLRLGSEGRPVSLGAQHVANGVTDRQESTNYLGGLAADPLSAAAVLDRDRDSNPRPGSARRRPPWPIKKRTFLMVALSAAVPGRTVCSSSSGSSWLPEVAGRIAAGSRLNAVSELGLDRRAARQPGRQV